MAIRTEVTFRTDKFCSEPSIPSTGEPDQQLGEDTARWLIGQLPLHGFLVEKDPCEEDWGWVVFASCDTKRFWIGTSPTFDDGHPEEWIIHLHHWDFAIMQRFTRSGRSAFAALSRAIHQILTSCPDIIETRWHFEGDVKRNRYELGAATPEAG